MSGYGGVCPKVCWDTHPRLWTEFLTHACENITLFRLIRLIAVSLVRDTAGMFFFCQVTFLVKIIFKARNRLQLINKRQRKKYNSFVNQWFPIAFIFSVYYSPILSDLQLCPVKCPQEN